MPWIESHASLYEHRKTRKAARLLGVSVPTIMGHLHCLWHWALTHAEDGDLASVDDDDVAFGAKWDDDPQKLIESLLGCGKGSGAGFLERVDGDLRLHDWSDYAGKLMARRAASRERAKASRERARNVRAGAAIPNQTEPDSTQPNPTAATAQTTAAAACFSQPALQRAALETVARRRDNEPGWKPRSMPRYLKGVQAKFETAEEVRELLVGADERERAPPPRKALTDSERAAKTKAEMAKALGSGPNSGTIAQLQQKNR